MAGKRLGLVDCARNFLRLADGHAVKTVMRECVDCESTQQRMGTCVFAACLAGPRDAARPSSGMLRESSPAPWSPYGRWRHHCLAPWRSRTSIAQSCEALDSSASWPRARAQSRPGPLPRPHAERARSSDRPACSPTVVLSVRPSGHISHTSNHHERPLCRPSDAPPDCSPPRSRVCAAA